MKEFSRTIPRSVDFDVMAKVVPMFYKGYPCSRIDRALKLEKGTSKDAVMTYWFETKYKGKISV